MGWSTFITNTSERIKEIPISINLLINIKLKLILINHTVPNILIHGNPGSGKLLLLKYILNVLIIQNSISFYTSLANYDLKDTLINKLKIADLSKHIIGNNHKKHVIIIRNIDCISPLITFFIRRLLEVNSQLTRYFFTANKLNFNLNSLISRTIKITIKPTSDRMFKLLVSEMISTNAIVVFSGFIENSSLHYETNSQSLIRKLQIYKFYTKSLILLSISLLTRSAVNNFYQKLKYKDPYWLFYNFRYFNLFKEKTYKNNTFVNMNTRSFIKEPISGKLYDFKQFERSLMKSNINKHRNNFLYC